MLSYDPTYVPPPGQGHKLNPFARVVKEGILTKQGEHIKNWRPRYFILYDDGVFLGFKHQPPLDQYYDTRPWNDFRVKDCQTLKVDWMRENAFMLRGLQEERIIERKMCAPTLEARDEWVNAIRSVTDHLKAMDPSSSDDDKMDTSCEDILNRFAPNMEIRRKRIEDFELLKVLGKGTFGKVILAKDKTSRELYAIKVLKKSVIIAKEEIAHTLTERRVLQKAKHPFLTSLSYAFQNAERLFLVIHFAIGGDLYTHLNREVLMHRRGFSEQRTKFYGAEIISAIGYLHDHSVVYRDMKLENLLLDRDGHIKIADFGLCKENISYGGRTQTFCGTPEYLAPEILIDGNYGRSVDWWGTGVVMYEMMCGRLPFYSKEHEKLFEQITKSQLKLPSKLSLEARSLLNQLLAKVPSQRLGCSRDDAKEIMIHSFFADINWTDLYNKKIRPPFVPTISSDTDTCYFDQEFTREKVELTPPEPQGTPSTSMAETEYPRFQQFSYHGSKSDQPCFRTLGEHNDISME